MGKWSIDKYVISVRPYIYEDSVSVEIRLL